MAKAKSAAKKTGARKAGAGKTAAKKTAAKKTAAKKTTAKKAPAKKTAAKKAPAKKTAAKKAPAKKTAAKKAPAKKTAAKKAPAKKTAAKKAPAKKAPAKKTASKKTARKTTAARSASRRPAKGRFEADTNLFAPLSEGERADVLRTLIEDKRLVNMAKVGRYRVIAVEPLVLKPPHPLTGHRLGRVALYDYATDRSLDACVDLDAGVVSHLQISKAQPMLAREEEAAAVGIALADDRVGAALSLGDEPQVAMHYWSRRESELAYNRRSAAVMFGQKGQRPSLVVVVDLLDGLVAELIRADQW